MSPEALRQRAHAGNIPAYKPGKRWVFLEVDLRTYLTGGYAEHGQALRATPTHGGKQPCRSINAEKCGGSVLPPPTASEYTKSTETADRTKAQELYDTLKAQYWREAKLVGQMVC